MNALQIESGIPIPPPKRGDGSSSKRRSHSPFADSIRSMEVGQSVLLERQSQANYAAKILRAAGREYATRKLKTGWRFWRTA